MSQEECAPPRTGREPRKHWKERATSEPRRIALGQLLTLLLSRPLTSLHGPAPMLRRGGRAPARCRPRAGGARRAWPGASAASGSPGAAPGDRGGRAGSPRMASDVRRSRAQSPVRLTPTPRNTRPELQSPAAGKRMTTGADTDGCVDACHGREPAARGAGQPPRPSPGLLPATRRRARAPQAAAPGTRPPQAWRTSAWWKGFLAVHARLGGAWQAC